MRWPRTKVETETIEIINDDVEIGIIGIAVAAEIRVEIKVETRAVIKGEEEEVPNTGRRNRK